MQSDRVLRIAAVSEKNLEALLPLVEAYQRFYEVTDIDPERNRRFFARLLDNPDEGLQFLCYRQDSAVGFTTLYFPFSSTRAGRFALMNDLYVTEAVRGQGAGRALIAKAREVAAARGFPDMYWMTAQDNRRAQRLYDSLPAEKTGWFEYRLRHDCGQ